MEFRFSEEQRELQAAWRQLLDKQCPPGAVRGAWAAPDGRVPGLWAQAAAMGVVGLLGETGKGVGEVGEGVGETGEGVGEVGEGVGEVDLVLLLEEAGRAALPEPLLETAGVAVPLLRDAGARAWTDRIAAGEALAVVALPGERYVVGAGIADAVIAAGDEEVRLVERDDLSIVEQPRIDRGRRAFSVACVGAVGERLATGEAARRLAKDAFERAALGGSAHLLGLAERMTSVSAEYAAAREQFGRPIGSFQAVKHHLANALIAVEFARPAVYRAALSVATGSPERARDVSMAKVFASQAALVAARTALQVHGAVGYTWDHDLHLFMKPAWVLAASYGDIAWHRRRVAGELGLAGS